MLHHRSDLAIGNEPPEEPLVMIGHSRGDWNGSTSNYNAPEGPHLLRVVIAQQWKADRRRRGDDS